MNEIDINPASEASLFFFYVLPSILWIPEVIHYILGIYASELFLLSSQLHPGEKPDVAYFQSASTLAFSPA